MIIKILTGRYLGIPHQILMTDEQQLANELSHQTILTEEDWEKFKTLSKKYIRVSF